MPASGQIQCLFYSHFLCVLHKSGYLSSVGSEDSFGSYLSRSAVQKIPTPFGVGIFSTGSYLSSQAASSQVLSTYKGLTTVFGMGTGGSP